MGREAPLAAPTAERKERTEIDGYRETESRTNHSTFYNTRDHLYRWLILLKRTH